VHADRNYFVQVALKNASRNWWIAPIAPRAKLRINWTREAGRTYKLLLVSESHHVCIRSCFVDSSIPSYQDAITFTFRLPGHQSSSSAARIVDGLQMFESYVRGSQCDTNKRLSCSSCTPVFESFPGIWSCPSLMSSNIFKFLAFLLAHLRTHGSESRCVTRS
jgi:hypothetical protein